MKEIIFLLMMVPMINMVEAQNGIYSLNKDWRMKPVSMAGKLGMKQEWLPTAVPALAHSVLMNNGVIPDLFYRDNETKYQFLEREDWVFEKKFKLEADLLAHEHVLLNCKGLDTYADVFLNGELILKANNAFRSWQVDVKKNLRVGENYLRIFFYAAVKMDEDSQVLNGYSLPGGPTNERVFSRKGQFNYGWDWGPRFVSSGIWRDIELQYWDEYRLTELNIIQSKISKEEAILKPEITIESTISRKVELALQIEHQEIKKEFSVEKGLNVLHFDPISIKNPELWWSNGLGKPSLYTVKVSCEKGFLQQKIGLRTLELVRDKDEKEETFYFKLNGVPVFAKGANYIPLSIFQDKVSKEHYREMVDNAAAANMNMLRVWGGGIYENDEFYDFCDEKGIMVWQDFMFACAMYPGDKAFVKNVEQEAIENIKRLRHHPSIALWCGNNEIDEAWHNWGWQELLILHPARKQQIWADYKKLFAKLLPELVATYGNGAPYWESSPSFGRANAMSLVQGDSHYWGVWHDEEPFEQYAKKVPRFMSEYGFQSFPEWKTMLTYTEAKDRDLETPVMLVHQKHPRGNTLMRKYMGREYQVPSSFEDFTYVSQIVQAEGMRRGIEAHRRAMPYCMGSLYWQLNDVWPVASWSGIDGLGRWKALHYFARESFAPTLISPTIDNGQLQVDLVRDDTASLKQAALEVKIIDFDGNMVSEFKEPLSSVCGNSSSLVLNKAVQPLLKGHSDKECLAVITLIVDEKIISKKLLYFAYPKFLKLPKPTITHQFEEQDGQIKITLRSDKLAKNVFLQTDALGHFDDNYFDLLPGESKEVYFKA
ncbi:MAG: beta-mannosidase, partial [Saprospiraceae bacterium]